MHGWCLQKRKSHVSMNTDGLEGKISLLLLQACVAAITNFKDVTLGRKIIGFSLFLFDLFV